MKKIANPLLVALAVVLIALATRRASNGGGVDYVSLALALIVLILVFMSWQNNRKGP